MPNHVTTILRTVPDIIESILTDGQVDFNKVIPFPEELNALTAEYKVFTTQAEADAHQAEVDKMNANLPEFLRLQYDGKVHAITEDRQRELVEKYGLALDWYNWNTTHWGTKWNAYDTDLAPDITGIAEGINPMNVTFPGDGTRIVQFDTAWASPEPVILALSAKFPHDLIHVIFADEDLGSNYGFGVYRGGERIEGSDEPLGRGTDAANDFAARVKYGKSYADLRAEWDEDDEV